MATLPIYDMSGKKVGDYEIDPASLAPKISRQLMHDAVVMYLANQRQGSAKTKTRAEVAGSTKKMYRQKGTGNARAGSRRSPVRRGGGHANARKNRSWYYRLNKKAIRKATLMAIASKIDGGSVSVIDKIELDQPKTSKVASTLKAIGMSGQSVSLATAGVDQNVYKSGRNIPGVIVSPVADLNALNVLRPKNLVFTKDALDWLKEKAAS